MEFLTAACSDVGIKKQTNQDSFSIKVANTFAGTVVMAVICDGMGGLAEGEVASADIINTLSVWFEKEFPSLLKTGSPDDIKISLDRIIQEHNFKIAQYGDSRNIKLGTTLTALLIVDDKYFIIAHVGDCRVYKLTGTLEVITEDQSVVAREVRRGTMTWEQAARDPRRNVLLQCIGASRTVVPDWVVGRPEKGCVYMLCSDGFRHVISSQEIFHSLNPAVLTNEDQMNANLSKLVDLCKLRNEMDNITAVLIKTR